MSDQLGVPRLASALGPLVPPLRSTASFSRMAAGNVIGDADTTLALTVDTIWYVPIIVPPFFGLVSRMLASVQTVGAAGSTIRLGVYANDGGTPPSEPNLPGKLLFGSDPIATDAGATNKVAACGISVSPGSLLWLAVLAGVAAPTVYAWSQALVVWAAGYDGNPGPAQRHNGYPKQAFPFAALPAIAAAAYAVATTYPIVPGLWASFE